MEKQSPHWVTTWGTAPSVSRIAAARYAKNITLRYVIPVMVSGTQLRLKLSNFGGTEAVSISRMAIAKCDANAVLLGESIPVTFQGGEICSMETGGTAESDPVPLNVSRGDSIAVSLYLGDFTELASGTEISGPLTRLFFCETEALTEKELSPVHSMTLETCFFLDSVDVWTEHNTPALVCFGDSITAQAWPDELVLRVMKEDRDLTVVRRGIGGSRIFHAYDNIQHRCYGPDGFSRFVRELHVSGVDRVVILHGINDMMHPEGSRFRPWSDLPTAEELIEGLRWYIKTAHELGLKVCLGTCVTFKGWHTHNEKREAIRQQMNQWIRTQTEADAVADFDAATCDPQDPENRDPACDSGDHVHPSAEGARRMAACVPEEFLNA